MLISAALRKTGSGWEFESEEALEGFVEIHLQDLLSLTIIKRQYTVNEQRCDIIAVDEQRRLVVLELKNGEDRYIVQQLTRYYDALRETKPFTEQVDYEQPVHLVAITPRFHRDNFTDKKYSTLFFQFLQFTIITLDGNLYLQLKDVDTDFTSDVQLTYQERESADDIPSPPKALIKLLSKCELSQQEEILRIRHKILSFDRRMKEIVSGGSIKYGTGENKSSKFCAEFCSDSKGTIILFLWLPLKGLTSKTLGRARIWTDWNENALIEGYVSIGIGSKISSEKRVIATKTEKMKLMLNNFISRRQNRFGFYSTEFEFIIRYLQHINKNAKKYEISKVLVYEDIKYMELIKDVKNCLVISKVPSAAYPAEFIDNFQISSYIQLSYLIDLALQKWLERL